VHANKIFSLLSVRIMKRQLLLHQLLICKAVWAQSDKAKIRVLHYSN